MMIDFNLQEEKEQFPKLLKEAISKGQKFSLINIFDKAGFIEELWGLLETNKKVSITLDEDDSNYPNILQDKPPRFVIYDDKNKVSLSNHFAEIRKKGFDITLDYNKNEYILTLHKNNDESLNLGLKLDRDRTIDLAFLSDRTGKDKVFFGVKSFYNKK